jgi:hypothetical protein
MKGITTNTIVRILLGVLFVIISLVFLYPYLRKKITFPVENPGEIKRFISYVRCSMAACIGGCNSGETIVTSIIDNDGERISCNELLIKENYCTEYNTKNLCGED